MESLTCITVDAPEAAPDLRFRFSCARLFTDDDGCKERAQLLARNDHLINVRGRLMYHIELIRLFALTTRDGHAENQRWLQAHLSLGQLTELLRTPSLPYVLQTVYVNLLRNGYLAGKRANGAIAFIEVEQILRERITQLTHDLLDVDTANTESADSMRVEMELLLFQALLPTLRDLYRYSPTLLADLQASLKSVDMGAGESSTLHVELTRLASDYSLRVDGRPEQFKLISELLSLLFGATAADAKLAQAIGRPLTLSEKSSTADVPAALTFSLQKPPTSNKSLQATELKAHEFALGSAPASSKPAAKDESTHQSSEGEDRDGLVELSGAWRHPQELLGLFIDGLIPNHDTDTEFDGLVAIFQKDVDAYAAWMEKGEAGDASVESFTQRLIHHLKPNRSSIDDELTEHELQQTCTSLRLLAQLLVLPHEESTADEREVDAQREEVRRRQRALNAMGASAVALSMAASDNDALCKWGLELAVALLNEANRDVQLSMHGLLSDPTRQDMVKPFDGSASHFLASMRERIRVGGKEIASRKMYEERQKSLLATLDAETRGLGAAAKKRYVDTVKKPFPSRANVLLVLRMLQLLCEGHNSTLQDYMCSQPNEPTNVDLVVEVYHLFENLQRQLDATNIDQLLQCVSTITEFVQGNQSGCTADALVDTKLLDQLSQLLAVDDRKNDQRANLKGRLGTTTVQLAQLQEEISILLLSLIESESTMAVHERMRRAASKPRVCFTLTVP